MQELDKEKCGAFIAQLRKQKGMTQKQLAQELMLSDKAISKWERGLSMPDISVLIPLSKILNITTTELLCGERMEAETMAIKDVEQVVSNAISLSDQEDNTQKKKLRKQHITIFLICVLAVLLETLLLFEIGYTLEMLSLDILVVELLSLIFGAWFGLFAKEKLPAYYDQNQISAYSDGIFRMNVPGVHFNNSNWPHILTVGRVWMQLSAVIFPIIYLIISQLSISMWRYLRLPLQLTVFIGFFIAVYVVGKKYE